MELRIAGKGKHIKEFELVQNCNGDIVIQDVEGGWQVAGLRSVDGRVTFIRYSHIGDGDYLTDGNGRIQEVDEYSNLDVDEEPI